MCGMSIVERRMQNAERGMRNAERGMRNAERLCSAKATQTRKDYISAECSSLL